MASRLAPSATAFSLRRLAAAASQLMAGRMGSLLLSLVQSLLITRSLGVAAYGIWGAAGAFSSMIMGFLGVSFAHALTREIVAAKTADDTDRLGLALASTLACDFAFKLAAVLMIVVAAPVVATKVAGGPEHLAVYRLYSLIVLAAFPETTWFSVARDIRKFWLIAVIPVCVDSLRVALTGWLVWRHSLDVFVLTKVTASIELLQCATWLLLLDRVLKQAYGLRLATLPYRSVFRRRREMAELWRFTASIYLSTCCSSLWKSADVLLVGYYGTATAVGLYALAKRLASVVRTAFAALSAAIYQDYNELLATGATRTLLRSLRRTTALAAGVSAVELVVLYFVSPYLFAIYGEGFGDSTPLFRILLLGEMGLQTLFWAYSLLLAMNGHRLALRLTAVASLIGVACTIAAAKLAGPLGVAVVTSAVWIGLYAVIGVKAVRMAEGQCERGAAGEPAVLDASGPSA